MSSGTKTRVTDQFVASARNHLLLTTFTAFEVILLVVGFALGIYADSAAAGSETSLAHTAGIMGALAVVLGALGVTALLIFHGFLLWNRLR